MNKKQYEQAVEELKRLAEKYENNSPEVDDTVYDKLYKQVKEYEKKNNINNPSSPTQIIGSTTQYTNFPVSKHWTPMYSLSNLYNTEDIEKFYMDASTKALETGISNLAFIVEPKVDGLSLNLKYQNGKLAEAVTRGAKGIEGENIIQNIQLIQNIPMEIPHKDNVEIRGEVYITNSEFENYNKRRLENGESEVKTKRGAASGALRNIDTPDSLAFLNFLFYNNQQDQLDLLIR